MDYNIVWVRGHVEVYDWAGRLCFSADNDREALEELEDLSSLPQHPVKASDITSTTATMRAENFKCFMLLHPFLTILILLPPPGVPKQKTNGFFVSSFSLHSPPRIIYPGQRYILTFCLQQ